ncbi:MAG: sel1 repeat family protein [Planctomycetes bacterium]|nr:sel1 repeat family protein [Planctomycetota bacterium]
MHSSRLTGIVLHVLLLSTVPVSAVHAQATAAEISEEGIEDSRRKRLVIEKDLRVRTPDSRTYAPTTDLSANYVTEEDLEEERRQLAQQRVDALERQALAEERERQRIKDNERARIANIEEEKCRQSLLGALRTLEMAAPGSAGSRDAVDTIAAMRPSKWATGFNARMAHAWLQVEGVHVPADAAEGFTILKEGAEQVHAPSAMVRYAHCLGRGLGCARDVTRARLFYRASLARDSDFEGDRRVAMRRLAEMDEAGEGARADLLEAIRWYTSASALGDARSQLRLAIMRRDGVGMAADSDAATTALEMLATNADPVVATEAAAALGR